MTPFENMVWLQIKNNHPTPWTIEYDWCVEVYDAKHELIIKLMSDSDAHELVNMATRLAISDTQIDLGKEVYESEI